MTVASLRPLGSRNFALVWSSALVSNVGTWMQTVALGTLITLQTHNPLWTALVMAAGFLPMGIFAPVGGVLADRMDRRRWLMVTTVAEAMVAGGLCVMVASGHDAPGLLVLASALGGSAGALGFPSYQSMLPDLVEPQDLLAAVSLSSAQWNMGRVLGPALAGVVLVMWSPAAAFGINAVSFGAVLVALCFVHLPGALRSTAHGGVVARLREGIAEARGEPACRSAIIMISVVALIGSPFIGLVASVAIDGLHRQAGGPAVLTTAQGIGAVVGALALAPLAAWAGRRRIVVSALVSFSLALIAYGAAPSLWTAAVAISLVGGTYIGVLAGLNTVVQVSAPTHARGRILSIYMTALGMLYPIGLIAEGALAQLLGVRLLTMLSGAVLLVIVAAIAAWRPAVLASLGHTSAFDVHDRARETEVSHKMVIAPDPTTS